MNQQFSASGLEASPTGDFPSCNGSAALQGLVSFLPKLSEPPQKAIIKLVPADQEEAAKRMAAWEAATALSHPNLMQVFAYGRCQIDSVPLFYVVTEFADEVLAEVLRERPLTPQETHEMLGPALDALSYLHGKGFDPQPVEAVEHHGRQRPLEAVRGWPLLFWNHREAVSGANGVRRAGGSAWVWSGPRLTSGRWVPHSWRFSGSEPPVWDGTATSEPVVPGFIPPPFAALARDCLRTDPAKRCTLQEIKARLESGAALRRSARKAGNAPHVKGRVPALIGAAAILLAGIGIWIVFSHRAQPPSPAAEQQNVQANAPEATPTEGPATTPAPVEAPTPPPAPAAAPAATSIPAPAPAPAAALPPAPTAENPAPSSATVNGAVTKQVQPNVLPSALKTVTGTIKVTVRLAVDENGNVTDASIELAGPSKYFANKALEAARRWQFKPAQVDGQAVPSAWLLQFLFRQSGITVTPEKSAP